MPLLRLCAPEYCYGSHVVSSSTESASCSKSARARRERAYGVCHRACLRLLPGVKSKWPDFRETLSTHHSWSALPLYKLPSITAGPIYYICMCIYIYIYIPLISIAMVQKQTPQKNAKNISHIKVTRRPGPAVLQTFTKAPLPSVAP